MFKCLCGGSKATDNATNHAKKYDPREHHTASSNGHHTSTEMMPYTGSSATSPESGSKPNPSTTHPPSSQAGMTPLKPSTVTNSMTSSSNRIITHPPSTATHSHLNGQSNPNPMVQIQDDDDEDDDPSIHSKSPSSYTNKSRPKHLRKRTHPYKSRDPHKGSLSARMSPVSPRSLHSARNTTYSMDDEPPTSARSGTASRRSHFQGGPSLDDYFVSDHFAFSVETFDFNAHYKFLLEVAIKCLGQGPETLNPQMFFKHNAIRCVVAILHENNHKKVPSSYFKDCAAFKGKRIRSKRKRSKHSKKQKKRRSQKERNGAGSGSGAESDDLDRIDVDHKNGNDLNERHGHSTSKGNTGNRAKPLLSSHRSDRNEGRDRKEREEILLNNMIGFAIVYPHSNCRPYPDSVWMIGWLCCDHIRVQSADAQDAVLEGLIRECFRVVNPHSTIPEASTNLKPHLVSAPTATSSPSIPKGVSSLSSLQKKKLSGLEEKDEHHGLIGMDHDDAKQSPRSSSIKKKAKMKDKGIGIYAPFHHQRAQRLYESLGFEKIAKIGNYYTTDKAFFDDFYGAKTSMNGVMKEPQSPSPHSHHSKSGGDPDSNKGNVSNDAYLYCRGELPHCRLLLGMEYFNYKKWPKPPTKDAADTEKTAATGNDDAKDEEKDDIPEKTKEKKGGGDEVSDDQKTGDKVTSTTDKSKQSEVTKDDNNKNKKRGHGPKILEEYLQKRIAEYHASQQREQLRQRKVAQTKERRDHKHHHHGHSGHNNTNHRHGTSSKPVVASSGGGDPNLNRAQTTVHMLPSSMPPPSSHGNSHHSNANAHHSSHNKPRTIPRSTSHYVERGLTPNNGPFDGNIPPQPPAYVPRSASAHYMAQDKRIRMRHHSAGPLPNGHANPHMMAADNRHSFKNGQHYYYPPNLPNGTSSGHSGDRNTAERDDENLPSNLSSPNPTTQTLSPGLMHHKPGSIVSDVTSNGTLNSSGHSAPKSSRNASVANSQRSGHHHHQHSGHYQNYHHPHYSHSHHGHHRPTYTSSLGRNESGVSSHRLSATPTTTYDAHSQAVYHTYPHLSNMSTATYTQTSDDKMSLNQGNTLRGNSYYSLNSNASHHSRHTAHTAHTGTTMQSHHSNHSTASMHSDPYVHPQYHRGPSHGSHYMHSSRYGGHPQDDQYRHPNHMKHHDSGYDDQYHSSHRSSRNKRYKQSRHKRPQ